MQSAILVALGAALVVVLMLLYYTVRHGWAWVVAKYHAAEAKAAADFNAKVAKALPASILARVEAVEAKLGITPSAA